MSIVQNEVVVEEEMRKSLFPMAMNETKFELLTLSEPNLNFIY